MSRKPLIGITMSAEKGDFPSQQFLGKQYCQAIYQAGGIPVALPLITAEDNIVATAAILDGLMISGGVDVNPLLFNEEPHPQNGRIDPVRDEMELAFIELFMQQKKAMFGICRGCQIITLALGGKIYQDLKEQKGGELLKHSQDAPRHLPTHSITISPNSKLSLVFKSDKIIVNSYHHQAISQPAPNFIVAAESSDGVIEAVEHSLDQYIVGVQWHPEHLWQKDPNTLALFKQFVENC